MAHLPVARLKSGMRLLSDLRNEKGVFLLPKGTVLNDSHISHLRQWQVIEADVEGEPQTVRPGVAAPDHPQAAGQPPRPTKVPPEIIAAAKAYGLKRFKRTDLRDEITREVFRLAVAHKAKAMFTHGQLDPGEPFPKPSLPETKACTAKTPLAKPLAELLDVHQDLLSLPSVLAKINTIVQDPRTTPEQAAEAIAMDPGLSSKLLRLVNSSYYGFVSKVDTLARAVTVVGSKQLMTLALGVSVTTMFRNLPAELFDLRDFWKHSLASAIIAGTLAAMIDKNTAERAFVAGLLHDIGRLVLASSQPQLCLKALCLAKIHSRSLHEVEIEVFGYDHAQVGAALMANWRLPASLENAVRFHHNPGPSAPAEASLVHLADILAHALEIGTSAEPLIPPLAPGAWERLRLPKEAVAKAAVLADKQIEDTLSAFLPERGIRR